MARTRIIVADDHAVLRSGLKLLINSQPDMQIVGEAGSHDEALRKARELKPDVMTLDLTMPGGTGVHVIESLSRECPQTRVVVLTMHDDAAYFRVAMAAGAFGYVVKQSADTELLDAIRCVARGKIYTQVLLAAASDRPAIAPAPPNGPTSLIDTLSEREREVLTMVAQGHTNQAIADRLDLSVKTVESYRARLMTKLGLHNRAELTQLAMEAGLLAGSGGQD
ncbi:response regulator [Anatilimnocola floriformis]|uniref:response regulator n=1 Tax=Anatilimnocola floriformis TaxID=2948575 RepID=UPI0020C2C376|nr:response regulator transcription factor [Anatilimnocola floriformis]